MFPNNQIYLKYGFCNKSFRKDEPLISWILFQHICPHFWAWLLLYSAIMPKSENKYVVKVFNWSEIHLSVMTLLQNQYFRYYVRHTNQCILTKFMMWLKRFVNVQTTCIENFPSNRIVEINNICIWLHIVKYCTLAFLGKCHPENKNWGPENAWKRIVDNFPTSFSFLVEYWKALDLDKAKFLQVSTYIFVFASTLFLRELQEHVSVKDKNKYLLKITLLIYVFYSTIYMYYQSTAFEK